MKKIKVLLTVITVLTILSTAVFAADSALTFGADTVAYTEGENITISVYSNVDTSIYPNSYFVVKFDKTIWNCVKDSSSTTTSGALTVKNTKGYVEVVLNRGDEISLSKGDKICDLVFTCVDSTKAVGSEIYFDDDSYYCSDGAGNIVNAYSGSITVKAAGPVVPETPVSVSTTMTVGEKEYTDVPNATVEGNVAEGALSISKILVNYWKDGVKVNTAKEFTNFTKPNFTGTSNGTVSFKVAIMGVPSNVVITAISAQ